MQHVKWKYPDRERDHNVHFLKDAEFTLCGSAVEGELTTKIDNSFEAHDQGFIETKERVSCSICINIVTLCKAVKNKEFNPLMS